MISLCEKKDWRGFLLSQRVPWQLVLNYRLFPSLVLASVFVLATVFLTLFFASRVLAFTALLVLATVFLTLLFAWHAVVFTVFLVLAAPFFADLNVLGAALLMGIQLRCY